MKESWSKSEVSESSLVTGEDRLASLQKLGPSHLPLLRTNTNKHSSNALSTDQSNQASLHRITTVTTNSTTDPPRVNN
jgi:hypothetical protein